VLTIAELAEQLCVSTQALYDRCKSRGPHGFRVGRRIRFRRSEVEAWLARLESEDHDRHDQHRDDPGAPGGPRASEDRRCTSHDPGPAPPGAGLRSGRCRPGRARRRPATA